MPSLTVRDIKAEDYENLRRIAKANNRSASAQIRDMIAELRRRTVDPDQAVADLLQFRRQHALKPRDGEDAVSMIRAVRGE